MYSWPEEHVDIYLQQAGLSDDDAPECLCHGKRWSDVTQGVLRTLTAYSVTPNSKAVSTTLESTVCTCKSQPGTPVHVQLKPFGGSNLPRKEIERRKWSVVNFYQNVFNQISLARCTADKLPENIACLADIQDGVTNVLTQFLCGDVNALWWLHVVQQYLLKTSKGFFHVEVSQEKWHLFFNVKLFEMISKKYNTEIYLDPRPGDVLEGKLVFFLAAPSQMDFNKVRSAIKQRASFVMSSGYIDEIPVEDEKPTKMEKDLVNTEPPLERVAKEKSSETQQHKENEVPDMEQQSYQEEQSKDQAIRHEQDETNCQCSKTYQNSAGVGLCRTMQQEGEIQITGDMQQEGEIQITGDMQQEGEIQNRGEILQQGEIQNTGKDLQQEGEIQNTGKDLQQEGEIQNTEDMQQEEEIHNTAEHMQQEGDIQNTGDMQQERDIQNTEHMQQGEIQNTGDMQQEGDFQNTGEHMQQIEIQNTGDMQQEREIQNTEDIQQGKIQNTGNMQQEGEIQNTGDHIQQGELQNTKDMQQEGEILMDNQAAGNHGNNSLYGQAATIVREKNALEEEIANMKLQVYQQMQVYQQLQASDWA